MGSLGSFRNTAYVITPEKPFVYLGNTTATLPEDEFTRRFDGWRDWVGLFTKNISGGFHSIAMSPGKQGLSGFLYHIGMVNTQFYSLQQVIVEPHRKDSSLVSRVIIPKAWDPKEDQDLAQHRADSVTYSLSCYLQSPLEPVRK